MNLPWQATESRSVQMIRSPETVRTRCHEILQLGLAGQLEHFKIHRERLEAVCDFVIQITDQKYPDGRIPYHSRWSHFAVGGLDRVKFLNKQSLCGSVDALSLARMHYDLVVPSILLDAGAGMGWTYHDRQLDQKFSKSEGLAVASFDMFTSGLFSSDPKCPIQTDSQGLLRLRSEILSNAFQVSPDNPIVGLDGRLQLLKNLGEALQNSIYFSGVAKGRVGALVDYLVENFGNSEIQAKQIMAVVLRAFGSIWPGRLSLDGVNLGDVWRHTKVAGDDKTKGLVAFHKLSQWLTYSLIEPLEWCGIRVVDLDQLTGLAEYRNGGLFLDMKVIEPRDAEALKRVWSPGDEFVVEWRALTVALLDEVASIIRKRKGLSSVDLPLAKILQGGTWAAGRVIAKKMRSDGGSPVLLKSDGTVF